ncbi:MAG: C-GCAxxG-C-C family protein [Paludibacter sp.]|nr:C-GCAxxG-C-C family protein [Bacteroidales bacterium]MCM1069008.1 C-GCAxxG-C-C family protein [Prevotella sp.]MCM1353671.1 C-GCAxxG-C-C family protein [Bacteroides sp.]MCM1441980.1 C-GCAxxG-C-C family protein [Muribaculum sp.]MCM1481564.1 C-GCAxxG-C-C family protein [Paludibacter sp.]
MEKEDILRREQRAEDLFRQGFNCSQAVFAACADLYGIDETLALRLSASFGGGIGRMRQTCGAACGMFMLTGMYNGSATPHDNKGKMRNYQTVQHLAEEFRAYNGSLICAELLRLAKPEGTPQPEERTDAYYKKRPCIETIRSAVRIYCENLL